MPADDGSAEPIEHAFGTYKHPDFGSSSEAYTLKRQLNDTLSEYTSHTTVPSPRTSSLGGMSRVHANEGFRDWYNMTSCQATRRRDVQ